MIIIPSKPRLNGKNSTYVINYFTYWNITWHCALKKIMNNFKKQYIIEICRSTKEIENDPNGSFSWMYSVNGWML